ncbi:MAG: gliding motility-associated C-terminal domain-containing protein [Flavobacteriales bacterium]
MRFVRYLYLFLFLLLTATSGWSQDILLFSENFETGGGAFSLNNSGPGSNSGPNQWIINNQYTGTGGCADTPNQNNTTGGNIGGAPFSQYLHVQNTTAPSTNACFDQAQASDQFAYLGSGFCTYGLDDIHISFFWIGEGNANSYGSLWYQADGGGWIQLGGNFNNSSVWQYEDITNPAFTNVGNLQFGFRFQNDASGAGGELSFGVDDINVVATLSVADPVEISITSVAPNPVCEGTYLTISYELSQPLCDGTYLLELSNNGGTYPSPFTSWAINIAYPTTSGSTTILLPNAASAGDCYTVRLSRLSPEPAITGIASACFEIIECPNEITTAPLGPPVVTLDPLPVCVSSVIDIPFYSIGIFNANNAYVCQLSEPDGTFSANPPIVGSSPDPSTYDPSIVPQPGSVSGIIPDTEPGCNYYLRIVSTSPSAIGTVWGPFCIQRCDVTTNEIQDISFCITECANDPDGESQNIVLDINTNGQNVDYLPGNIFTTQLLSSQTFGQIGPNGMLGEVAATEDTQLEITVPCIEEALAMGIPIGMNYLRVIATNPSDPSNTVSTLIRITIGVITTEPQFITSYDYSDFSVTDTLCAPASVLLLFNPYDPSDGSTYMWSCSGINNGVPFESPNGATSNVLLVTANAPTILEFSVQRTNNGCVSPWNPVHTVVVAGPPVVFVTGPSPICLQDTVSYQVPFIGSTYYSWTTDALPGEIAFQDTSNNVLNIAFNLAGSYTLSLNVLNQCGANDDDYTVTVVDPPVASAGPDIDICDGDAATIDLATGPLLTFSWADAAGTFANTNSTQVSPNSDTEYYGTVTSNVGCSDTDTVLVIINYPEPAVQYVDSICPGGDNTIRLEADTTGQYDWSTGSTDFYAPVTDTGVYYLSVDIPNTICPHYAEYYVVPATPTLPVIYTDSVCPGGDQFIQLSADASGQYIWSNGQVNPNIQINDTGFYSLNIYSLDEPCPRILHFYVEADTCLYEEIIPWVFEPLYAWVPNSFTANSDRINDVYGPVFSNIDLVRDYRFIIYDRWGTVVFESTDPHQRWTGEYRDGEHFVTDGVYSWLLFFRGRDENNSQSTSGIVTVIR